MRDHTQENYKENDKKCFLEKFSRLKVSVGQNVFCDYLTQQS